MQTLHETELTYTQDHKLDLNGMARTLLEDLVNTVMVEQVEELGCVRNGQNGLQQRISWINALFSLKNPQRESHVHKRPSTISYK